MNSGALGWCAPAVQQVQHRQHRVPQQHAGSGVAHHRADPLAHPGLVAVDGTVGAGGLAPAKRAPVNALQGVSLQLRAVRAEPVRGVVVRPAVHADHDGDGLAFTRDAFFSPVHGEDFTTLHRTGQRGL